MNDLLDEENKIGGLIVVFLFSSRIARMSLFYSIYSFMPPRAAVCTGNSRHREELVTYRYLSKAGRGAQGSRRVTAFTHTASRKRSLAGGLRTLAQALRADLPVECLFQDQVVVSRDSI